MQDNEFSHKRRHLVDDEINVIKLLSILYSRRFLIGSITLISAICSLFYVIFLYSPVYEATATIQEKESDFFEHKIDLLKSRHVIGEAVDTFKLYIVAKPKLFSTVFARLYRDHELSADGATAPEKLNTFKYSWSGGQVEVASLEVPKHLINEPLTLRLKESNQIVLQHKKNILLQGKVGEELSVNGVKLNVQSFSALPGTEFAIIRKDRLKTIMDIKNDIKISEREDGIFSLSYKSENLQMASARLDQIIKIYVRQHTDSNTAKVRKSLALINKQIPELEKQLKDAKQKFNDRIMQYQSNDLNASVHTNLDPQRLFEIENKLRDLKLSRIELSHRMETDAVDHLSVIDYAVVDATLGAGKSRTFLFVVFISLVGFGLASTYVLVMRTINRGLEDLSELEVIDLDVYAAIPQHGRLSKINQSNAKKRKRITRKLIAANHPADHSIEPFRSLRTNLCYAMLSAKNNIVVISGPSSGVGKSFVSANLSVVIAQGGKKVLLIDADLRNGDLQNLLGISSEAGLIGYLTEQYEIEDVVHATDVKGLDILPRGIKAPDSAELLMHPRFSDLINYANEAYDVVIVDTPSILAVTDPAIIASHAGLTLLVARYGFTKERELELAQKNFEQNGVSVQGIVFNAVQKSLGNKY